MCDICDLKRIDQVYKKVKYCKKCWRKRDVFRDIFGQKLALIRKVGIIKAFVKSDVHTIKTVDDNIKKYHLGNTKNVKFYEALKRKFAQKQKTAIIIAGFPGAGKTYFYENTPKKVLDSDSSKFDKSNFPNNYIENIKMNIENFDIILVSTHKEVRDALVKNKLPFYLVYPELTSKDEFLKKYKERGNSKEFIKKIDKNWHKWINDLDQQQGCKHCLLLPHLHLSDVVKNIVDDYFLVNNVKGLEY